MFNKRLIKIIFSLLLQLIFLVYNTSKYATNNFQTFSSSKFSPNQWQIFYFFFFFLLHRFNFYFYFISYRELLSLRHNYTYYKTAIISNSLSLLKTTIVHPDNLPPKVSIFAQNWNATTAKKSLYTNFDGTRGGIRREIEAKNVVEKRSITI